MIPKLTRSTLVLAAALSVAAALHAQSPAPQLQFPAASPAGSLKQRVGLTDIEITYARPSAKGRQIFGGLVPYGEIWRTGADNATRIKFSTAVTLNGAAVPAGTYELFTIPGEREWTFILQTPQERPQWGSYTYDAKNDAARFTARPAATAAPVESLSFHLDDLRPTGATLVVAWDRVQVPVQIAIDTVGMLVPQIEAVMASDAERKPYFPSAMFYYENGLDLKQALTWMDAGLAANPNAFWMIYRKGLILAKMGDKAGARAAAEQSLALAEKDQRAGIREEYIRLNRALIASLD